MYRFMVVILAAAFANGLPYDFYFNTFADRIIGGVNAELGQFPYQAELKLTRHQCGGTILNNRWIVTAAHCVLGRSPKEFTIKVGTVNLKEGGDSYKLDKIVIHDDYDSSTVQNDIALIRTSSVIKFSSAVQPLPLADRPTNSDTDAIASGWGYIAWPAATKTNDLKFANLKVIDTNSCKLKMMFINTVTEKQICTFSNSTIGNCGGDSGGPLVQYGKLIGIVSWGVHCVMGYPDVYVNVYSYVDWIKNNMN